MPLPHAGRSGLHLAAMHNRLGAVLLLLREFALAPDGTDNLCARRPSGLLSFSSAHLNFEF